jgi:hypothetical protein
MADVAAGRKAPPQLLLKSAALDLNALHIGHMGKGGVRQGTREEAATLLCMAFDHAANVVERTRKVGA